MNLDTQMMYSIYHIEGVKIGVSKNPKGRVKKQGYDTFEILEEHTDIYEVSDRELQLQKEYGYKVDTKPYWKVVELAIEGGKIQGKIQGIKMKQSGYLKRMRKKAVIARRKPILQYDKDDNFIKEWQCAADACKELNLASSSVAKVCKGKIKTTKGFVFKYKE